MRDPSGLAATISTPRLDLVLLPYSWLRAFADGGALPDLGFDDPHQVLRGHEGLVLLRAEQIAADPSQEPWLLRMMVLRGASRGQALGYVNFHASPDERGMVEIGYRVTAHLRGQRFGSEAAFAMWDWAARHGARVLRASIAPDNAPSIALVRRAGFEPVGEQIDPEDGLEIIWERQATAPATSVHLTGTTSPAAPEAQAAAGAHPPGVPPAVSGRRGGRATGRRRRTD